MQPRTLNLGILAHVDAGKTTLTERLLYTAGVISEIGSVDAGTTLTDSLALERQRGITIRSAVASFAIGDVTVNLIDTPGHPDFIAEVERVLSVLDGAVLVISAVEGVQPQTRILQRALARLRLPTLLFVNKIDRAGADAERVLGAISRRLTPAIVPMGRADALGTRAARFEPWRAGGAASEAAAARGLDAEVPDARVPDAEMRAAEMRAAEVLAEYDDGIMAAYVDDEAGIPAERLRVALAAQTRRALVNPVFFGSAITGAGTDAIMAGIAELLPSAVGDAGAPTAGSVFKIERGAGGEKVAYVRMFAGTVRTRDRLRFGSPPPEQWSAGRDGPAGMQPGGGQADRARGGRVTAIAVFERGPAAERPSVSAGQIAKLWGLDRIQVGDHVWHETANRARAAGLPRGDGTSPPGQPADNGGQPRGQRSNQAPADQASLRRAPHDATPRGATPRGPAPEDPAPGDPSPRDGAGPGLSSDDRAPHRFARPTLESVVVPVRPGDRARLRVALGQLAEQDPLINVRQDDSLGEISVSLYGEVQKEVIAATLASDFGVEVTFRETTTICIERPLGSGEAAEVMGATGNPFPATLGLRVDAAPAGSGLAFRLDVGVRSVPLYVYKTTGSFAEIMTRNVRHALAEGLHGWEVTDCTVTLNRCAYVSPNTTAAHFRKLTPLVLLPALAQAGTVACEPMARMSIEIPADTSAAVLAAVARLGGVVETRPLAGGLSLVETVLPAARVQELQRRLPGLTNGEGVAETSFGGYRPVPGAPPVRRRTMPNPLNREEYLMYLTRPGALPH